VNPPITGITADSRAVGPGFLFAALPGSEHDGRDYIPDAAARGAAAILAPEGTVLPPDAAHLPLIAVTDPRHSLAVFAARFFGKQPEIAAAVTGTNGKTSVAWFTRRLWSALEHKAAAIGTLGVDLPEAALSSSGGLTTADPVTLHKTLRELADAGVRCVIVEASSHGLDQCRLDGLRLRAGAFTNLSRDHLDYHRDMEAYRLAKRRLFDRLMPEGAAAVLNADTDEFADWSSIARKRGLQVISYGRACADLKLIDTQPHGAGQLLTVRLMDKQYDIAVPIAGTFQAENILCAIGLVIACGGGADQAAAATSGLTAPPGRLELTGTLANGAAVYVDYAHTPDALSTVLTALRPHAQGKLNVLFGCGGDRDRGKRPEMGAIADRLADGIIVSDDNPRGENPASIRAEIMAASPRAEEIGDRAEAIAVAVGRLGPGDVLLIAGKGHESGQIVGNTILPFDDREVARQALGNMGGAA